MGEGSPTRMGALGLWNGKMAKNSLSSAQETGFRNLPKGPKSTLFGRFGGKVEKGKGGSPEFHKNQILSQLRYSQLFRKKAISAS